MKSQLRRALGVGAALLLPTVGLTCLGAGVAGAMSNEVITSTSFTLYPSGSSSPLTGTCATTTPTPVPFTATTHLNTHTVTYDHCSGWVTSINALSHYLTYKHTTRFIFGDTVTFAVTYGGTPCTIVVVTPLVLPYTGSHHRYAATINTAGMLKVIVGLHTRCYTLTAVLQETGTYVTVGTYVTP